MPVLKNARHERFAQEVARGKSPIQAYVAVGYKPHSGNASTMRGRKLIVARIEELQTEMAQSIVSEITRDHVLRWLQEDRDQAKRLKQTASAVRAAELLGKELGMFVDKSQRDLNVIQHVGDAPMSPQDWAQAHQAKPVVAPEPAPPEPEPIVSPPLPSAPSTDTSH